MLLTLVKNELIKLCKKAKTWIVFALFAIFIGIIVYAQHTADQNMRKYQDPQYQLQMAQSNLEYYTQEYEANKEDKGNPEYILSLQQSIDQANGQIKIYEDLLKNGVEEDIWKVQLEDQITDVNREIADTESYTDEWSKKYLAELKEKQEMLTYLRDNNIKPIQGWEYEAYNYMGALMQILAMAILLCGISVFMSDIVSGECTPATLKFLLVQPVSRGKVLLSKFIAVTLMVMVMVIGGELLGFTFVNLTSGISSGNYPVTIGTEFSKIVGTDGTTQLVKIAGSGHMGTNLELLVKSLLFQGLFIVAACSVVFLISTLIKSSMITMALSVVLTVFLTVASQAISVVQKFAHLIFVNYGDAISVLNGNTPLGFNNADLTIRNGIIVMIATIIISYGIAYFNFRNKDILI